jgi:flagellar hook-associated protein 3 FlgL
VQTQLTDISDLALLAGGGVDGPQLDAAATGARAGLDAIVSALNTSVSGRPLFSGSDLDSSPLPGSEALMSSVRSALIGATDAAAVRAALDGFFDSPGGGFDAAVYRGGNQDLAAVDLGAGESVRLSLRADDAALRSALKNTVIAALAGDAAITLGRGDRVALMQEAGRALLSDIDAVTGIRSDLGFAEARIDRAVARSSAEQTSLSMMRNEVMSVDLFETASALEQLQLQLETFYTVTARTSRLNLVNFL